MAPGTDPATASAVTFRKEKTMMRVKAILYGGTALLIAAGSATASPIADARSEGITMADSTISASAIYEVDEDRDGRTDRLLILEQSDSLG
jgi:hypothetical protein